MTPEEVREATFRSTVGRGYNSGDVDDLLARVAIQLEARQSPKMTIEHAMLRTSFGGYEPSDVDRLLDALRGGPQGEWESASPPQYRRARSAPVLKVALGGAALAGIGGAIGQAASSGTSHSVWEGVALVGVALIFIWMSYAKLASDTAVDRGFQVGFFVFGAAALTGGVVYAVSGHHGGMSAARLFGGLGIAALGALVVAAELRDTWHRYHEAPRHRTMRQAPRKKRSTRATDDVGLWRAD